MTTHREYQPLLCEEFSDEEQQYRCHRHQKLRNLKTRSRKRLKGAAHIIASWPGHWSLVKAIWLMLGVFALLIMALYNAVISIAAVQTGDEVTYSVFIHFFAEQNNQDFYLSYIKMIAEHYPELSYKLILVRNDTVEDIAAHEDYYESDFYNKKTTIETFVSGELRNAYFEEISLTKFLDESPLSRRWRDLPSEFLPFFVRAISVWNDGGIAINPLIITPASSNGKYENALQNILRSFTNNNTSNETQEQEDVSQALPISNGIDIIPYKSTKIYNNIRDIIEAIESEPPVKSQVNLTEAESQRNIEKIKRKLLSVEQSLEKSANNTNKLNYTHYSAHQENYNMKELTIFESLQSYFNNFFHSPIRRNNNNVTSVLHNFPMFIDLFTYKLSPNLTDLKTAEKKSVPTEKNPVEHNISLFNTESKIEKRDIKAGTKYHVISTVNTVEPAIIPLSENDQKIKKTKGKKINVPKYNIAIFVDTRGNLLASSTPCHAFLGNIFTRIDKRPNDESLSKFLMSEISYFCYGRLSQCGSRGLDYM